MKDFKSGRHGNFIYGHIFSSVDKGFVLDEGGEEFPIDSAEIWNGRRFVYSENLSSLNYKKIGGSKARIKLSRDLQLSQQEKDDFEKKENAIALAMGIVFIVFFVIGGIWLEVSMNFFSNMGTPIHKDLPV